MSELSVRLKLAEEAIEKLNAKVFGTTKDEPVKEAESNDLLGLDLKETKSESSEEGGDAAPTVDDTKEQAPE